MVRKQRKLFEKKKWKFFFLQGQGPRDKFTEVTEKSGGSTPFLGGGLLSSRLWGQRGSDQFPAILLGGTGKVFVFGMAINSPHSQCCVNYITELREILADLNI